MIQMYEVDFNDYFYTNGGTYDYWSLKLNELYAPPIRVFYCSEAITRIPKPSNPWCGYGATYTGPISMQSSAFSAKGYSNLVMVSCGWSLGYNVSFQRMTSNANNNYSQPHLVHLRKANMLFADGHVSGKDLNDLKTTYFITSPATATYFRAAMHENGVLRYQW